MIRTLWKYHGSAPLDDLIRAYPTIKPRNVTVTEDEKRRLLWHATPHMRLLILLCSDLALRSGTAARIAPEHYDAEQQTITVTSKKGSRVTIPCTEEVSRLIELCDQRNPLPFITQLSDKRTPGHAAERRNEIQTGPNRSESWKRLLKRAGIKRDIRLHDLRRTTAVKIYEATGDLRTVQAVLGHAALSHSVWYLDHALNPIPRTLLELVKNSAQRGKRSA